MTELNIENLKVSLTMEGSNVRVKSGAENVLLVNQDMDHVIKLIGDNFNVVKSYYEKLITKTGISFSGQEVHALSLSIVYFIYISIIPGK